MNTFALHVQGERHRLVCPEVIEIKTLAIEVADFNLVVVQDGQRADAFACERGRDVANEAARAHAQYVATRKHFLVEAADRLLAVLSSGNPNARDSD